MTLSSHSASLKKNSYKFSPTRQFLLAIFRILVIAAILSSFIVVVEPAPTDILMIAAAIVAPLAFLTAGRGLGWFLVGFSIYYTALIIAAFGQETNDIWVANVHFTHIIEKTLSIRLYMFLITYAVASYLYSATWRQTDALIRSVIYAGTICALLSTLAWFRLLPHSDFFFRDTFMSRMKGTFKDPNVMGPFLDVSFIFCLFRYYIEKQRIDVAQMAILGIAIVLSGSRGALLTLGLETAIFYLTIWSDKAWNKRPLRNFLTLIFLGLVFVFSAGALIEFGGYGAKLSARLETQPYDKDRFGAQREVLQESSEQPFGHGPGSAVRVSSLGVDPHNVYLKVLFEGGILGLFGWLIMSGVTAMRAWRAWRTPANAPQVRLLGATVFAALAAHYLSSLFIDSTHWRHLFVLFGIACAFPLTSQNDPRSTPVPRSI